MKEKLIGRKVLLKRTKQVAIITGLTESTYMLEVRQEGTTFPIHYSNLLFLVPPRTLQQMLKKVANSKF
jgi:hypothetical protein